MKTNPISALEPEPLKRKALSPSPNFKTSIGKDSLSRLADSGFEIETTAKLERVITRNVAIALGHSPWPLQAVCRCYAVHERRFVLTYKL